MAELVIGRFLAARVLFEIRVETVGGVGPDEVGPAWADRTAFENELLAQAGLGSAVFESRQNRAPVRVESIGLCQKLNEGGLPGAVLADQDSQAGREVEALAEDLAH